MTSTARTTTPARTRRPSTATMRKQATQHGVTIPADATPKEIVTAWEQAMATPVEATPAKQAKGTAPAKGKAPKQAKQAKASTPKAPPANCGCGCGRPAITSRATFLPGHDARLASVLGKAVTRTKDQQAQYAAMSPALKVKTDKIAATTAKANAVKALKAQAKADYAKALAAIG